MSKWLICSTAINRDVSQPFNLMNSVRGYKRYLICIFLLVVRSAVWAQGSATTDTLTNLVNASLANEAGKLFVHYDKTVYLPTETIWFTAYSLNSDITRYSGE